MSDGASRYRVNWKLSEPCQGTSVVLSERKREFGTPSLGVLVPLGYCQGFRYDLGLTATTGHHLITKEKPVVEIRKT